MIRLYTFRVLPTSFGLNGPVEKATVLLKSTSAVIPGMSDVTLLTLHSIPSGTGYKQWRISMILFLKERAHNAPLHFPPPTPLRPSPNAWGYTNIKVRCSYLVDSEISTLLLTFINQPLTILSWTFRKRRREIATFSHATMVQ